MSDLTAKTGQKAPPLKAVLVSDALRAGKDKLARGLGLNLVSGAAASDLLVCDLDADNFRKARAEALEAEKPVLMVLPGPTALNSDRLPGSFIQVVVRPSYLAQTDEGSEVACAALLAETIQAGRRADTPMLDQWRSLPQAADGGLRARGMTGDARTLQMALDNGHSTSRVETGFWALLAAKAQGARLSLDRVLEPVLQNNTIWFEPYTGGAVNGPSALEILNLIETRWAENDRPVHCFGAQYWNHPSISATFAGRGGAVTFHDSEEETLEAAKLDGGRIASWAGRTTPEFEEQNVAAGIELVRIEDGFLRSVGLGAGLAPGAMLAVDDQGIYYDPSRPSRLETLLETYDLSEAEVARGKGLIEKIVAARVSKYNFGKTRDFSFPKNREVVLVPGQVADDAAIRKSRSATIDCANVPNVNLELLKHARNRNPGAFIVFKPHPDVETGLRKGKLNSRETAGLADQVAAKANIVDLVEAVDRVETFSSLSGYEALLRGKQVTVHGLPFYAGWGLTEDLTGSPRRTRRRTLPEMVYLALVVYARTIDPVSMLPCSPEFLIGRLSDQRQDKRHLIRTAVLRHASWLGRKLGL